MSPQAPNTIVLIHGLWMTPLSWENWIERYQNAGYEVIAPAWPGMEDGIDAVRADPTAIEHLGIEEIINHYDTIIARLGVAADHHGPLLRGRPCRGVAGSWPRCRRSRDRRRRREGNHQAPVRAAEIRVPGPKEPG